MAGKKGKKEENLPAKKGSGEVITKEMADIYAEDAQENMEHVRDAFINISIKGARYKVDDKPIGDRGIEFNAIILEEIPVNVYYQEPYDPNNPVAPDCASVGGLKPDPAVPHMQSNSCITCKQNRFGSASPRPVKKGEKEKPSRGKACRNARRLVLKVVGVDMPVLLTIPPTSIKAFNSYMKELSRNEPPLPMFAVMTTFGFDSAVEYPRPLMSKVNILPFKEYMAMREYRRTQIVQDAMNAYASAADYAEEGTEENPQGV